MKSLKLPASARALLAAAGALLVMGSPAHASLADQYLAAKRNYPPQPGLTLQIASQSPDAYRGMTLEVTGRLMGIARTEDGASLMITTEQNGTLNLQMGEAPPWVQPGSSLRALVVIGGGREPGTTIGLPDLLVVALATASDVYAAEVRLQANAQKRAREAQEFSARQPRLSSHPLGDKVASSSGSAAAKGRPAPPRFRGASKSGAKSSASSSRSSLEGRSAQVSRGLSPASRSVYSQYRAAVLHYNRRLSDREADAITSSILFYSEQFDVDPRLVMALIIAESDFRPGITSHKGAMGLGQIMPDEAKSLGLTNPYDPVQNIGGAVYLLRGRLDKYSGGASRENLKLDQIILALASYNAGMGAVKKYGGVPPYRETRNYVKKVEKIYRQLCGQDVSS